MIVALFKMGFYESANVDHKVNHRLVIEKNSKKPKFSNCYLFGISNLALLTLKNQ